MAPENVVALIIFGSDCFLLGVFKENPSLE
jgi:hypothetical protein